MSKTLSSVAQQEFDSMVKHAYQSGGKLRDCLTLRSDVVGDIYKFRRMGKGLANQKASQADVTPMDISHALIPATSAAGTSLTAIAVGGAGFTVDKVRQAGAAFDGEGMPMEGRYITWTAVQKQQLLGSTEATSSDYMNVKALVNGDINSFYGFQFKLIETREEGGLPGAGSADATSYAYHRDALGMAIGIDQRTTVDWIAEKTSWLANGMLKAGSVVRDARGVIEIHTDETA